MHCALPNVLHLFAIESQSISFHSTLNNIMQLLFGVRKSLRSFATDKMASFQSSLAWLKFNCFWWRGSLLNWAPTDNEILRRRQVTSKWMTHKRRWWTNKTRARPCLKRRKSWRKVVASGSGPLRTSEVRHFAFSNIPRKRTGQYYCLKRPRLKSAKEAKDRRERVWCSS